MLPTLLARWRYPAQGDEDRFTINRRYKLKNSGIKITGV
jgi:hypothetical protein